MYFLYFKVLFNLSSIVKAVPWGSGLQMWEGELKNEANVVLMTYDLLLMYSQPQLSFFIYLIYTHIA